MTSRSPSESGDIFQVLPTEILTLIADVIRESDFATLLQLRLVCKAFNDLAEPQGFGSVSFLGDTKSRGAVVQRLRVLATEDHPYSRWAQTLEIEVGSLFPAMPDLVFHRESVRAMKQALDDKRALIGPAIESLRSLKSARFECQGPGESHDEVISALSRLPKLENLSLSFSTRTLDIEAVPPALDKFSNLHGIELNSMRLRPAFLIAVERMIASSSMTLESLKITPKVGVAHQAWGDAPHPATGEVQKIPTGKLTGNRVLPGLTKLILSAQNIALSASCVRTFPNLTQLEIYSFISGNVSPSFWDALGSAGIFLKSLSIFPVDEPVSKYLASYSGLKTLRVCHLPGHPTPTPNDGEHYVEATASNLFNSVLPKHQGTLRHLAFDNLKFDEFMMDDASIAKLAGCKFLQTLWIGYDHVISRDVWTMDLTSIIARILATFPHLETLTMEAIPHNPLYRLRAASALKAAMRIGFWGAIRAAQSDLGVDLVDVSAEKGTVRREHPDRKALQIEWRY